MKQILLWGLLCGVVAGQNPQTQVQALKQELAALQKNVNELAGKVSALQMENGLQKSIIDGLVERSQEDPMADPVELLLQEKSPFVVIGTRALHLAISFRSAESHLSGTRIHFSVVPLGTFCAMSTKLTLLTRKARPSEKDKGWTKWFTEGKTTEIDTETILCPGKWTDLSVTIPEVKAQDFGYLAISAAVSRISPVFQ